MWEVKWTMADAVFARGKGWVCSRSIGGIEGSNPSGGTDVCFLVLLCVVSVAASVTM
jgi:hypothetical protein